MAVEFSVVSSLDQRKRSLESKVSVRGNLGQESLEETISNLASLGYDLTNVYHHHNMQSCYITLGLANRTSALVRAHPLDVLVRGTVK